MADLLLLIVSSPSGAGKTTLTRKLLESFPNLTFSVSHTTRAPRDGEIDGRDYHFVNSGEFEELAQKERFAEWAEVHGNFYGTSLGELDRARDEGRSGIVFDVDYQGARQIKARLPGAVGVFILPPSMEELRRRLTTRATDSAAAIARRFANSQVEIEHYPFFDYLVINDLVDDASERLRGIVDAELCRRHRIAARAETLLSKPTVD